MAPRGDRFGNAAGERHFLWLWLPRCFAVTSFFPQTEPSLQRQAACGVGHKPGGEVAVQQGQHKRDPWRSVQRGLAWGSCLLEPCRVFTSAPSRVNVCTGFVIHC